MSPGWNTPCADADVKEQRHAHAVDGVAVVVGRSAAHVEVRQPAGDGRDTRQHLDRAKGIAEGTRQLAHVAGRQRGLAGNVAPLAPHRRLEQRFGRGLGLAAEPGGAGGAAGAGVGGSGAATTGW